MLPSIQSYALYVTGVGETVELTSCLQPVGESGEVSVEQFHSLLTEAVTSHEKVVLNLVQDGKRRLYILLAAKTHAG